MKKLLFCAAFAMFSTLSFAGSLKFTTSCGDTDTMYAQDGDTAKYEIYYRLTFQKDTVEHIETEDFMVLRTNGRKSIFFSKDAYALDSLLLTSNDNALALDIIANGAGKYGKRINSYCVLKDFDSRKLEYTDNVGGDLMAYAEDIPQMEWKIAGDQKQIMDYNCQKAVCDFRGRRYEAWFTADIPLADGPWKFQGLPGLVMEVYDTARQYVFEFVGMHGSEATIKLLDGDYATTTREKYLKTQKGYIKDPIGYMAALAGMEITLDGMPMSRKKPKARYSPMELY